jgi:hypothetical protein
VKPERIKVIMAGGAPLYERPVLAAVVGVLRGHPQFAPETWGLDERSRFPFDEEEVLGAAEGRPSAHVLQLRRARRVKHTTLAPLGRHPGFSVDVDPRTAPRDWPLVFELGDRLAAAYRPDVGWVHCFTSPPAPFESEDERVDYTIDAGVDGTSAGYGDHGPGGLGLRTYLGPRLVGLLGADRLRSVPAVVRPLDGGGVSIDLVERPWQAAPGAIRDAWQRVTEHLRPAGVLAEVKVSPRGAVDFTRGPRFTLPASA